MAEKKVNRVAIGDIIAEELQIGYVIATKDIVDKKMKVRFMYVEYPDNDQDSGWRFSTGYEDEEYANDPNNSDLYDVRSIIAVDPDIVPYLHCEPRIAFERETTDLPFIVSDFEFPEPEEE